MLTCKYILMNSIQPLTRYPYRASSEPSSREEYDQIARDGPTHAHLPPPTHQYSQGQGQGQDQYNQVRTDPTPPQPPKIYPSGAYRKGGDPPRSVPPQPGVPQLYYETTSPINRHLHVHLRQPPPGFQPNTPSSQQEVSNHGSNKTYKQNPRTWALPPPVLPSPEEVDVASLALGIAGVYRDQRDNGGQRGNRPPEVHRGQGGDRGPRNPGDNRGNNRTHEEDVAEARRGKELEGGWREVTRKGRRWIHSLHVSLPFVTAQAR